jgi:predicted double-glycine peptidase
MNEKQAGGEIISRFLGLLSRPFVGAAKSRGLQQSVQQGITNKVNIPLENALRNSPVHGAVKKFYQVGMTPVPGTPKLVHPILPTPEQRSAYAGWKADNVVHTMAHNPDAALVAGAGTLLAGPLPGVTESYLAGKHLIGRALGDKGQIKKIANYIPSFTEELVKTAQVDPYQQLTQWTCSAACLKAVFSHYGVEISEEDAVTAIGTREGRGAECNEIAEGARKLGFAAFEHSFTSIDQARVLLDQQIPIICDIQSFNHPGKGHYVVMVSAGPDSVDLMDPNTPGNWRTISIQEMDERWWDRAMAPPHELMPKWGIVIVPGDDND